MSDMVMDDNIIFTSLVLKQVHFMTKTAKREGFYISGEKACRS